MKSETQRSIVMYFITAAVIATVQLQARAAQPIEVQAVRVNNMGHGAKVLREGGGWSPRVINVYVDETVTLRVTATDATHQFSIPSLGVKSPTIAPGQTVDVTFVPTRVGKFSIRCSSVCGPLHARMTGTLVVTRRPAQRSSQT